MGWVIKTKWIGILQALWYMTPQHLRDRVCDVPLRPEVRHLSLDLWTEHVSKCAACGPLITLHQDHHFPAQFHPDKPQKLVLQFYIWFQLTHRNFETKRGRDHREPVMCRNNIPTASFATTTISLSKNGINLTYRALDNHHLDLFLTLTGKLTLKWMHTIRSKIRENYASLYLTLGNGETSVSFCICARVGKMRWFRKKIGPDRAEAQKCARPRRERPARSANSCYVSNVTLILRLTRSNEKLQYLIFNIWCSRSGSIACVHQDPVAETPASLTSINPI